MGALKKKKKHTFSREYTDGEYTLEKKKFLNNHEENSN